MRTALPIFAFFLLNISWAMGQNGPNAFDKLVGYKFDEAQFGHTTEKKNANFSVAFGIQSVHYIKSKLQGEDSSYLTYFDSLCPTGRVIVMIKSNNDRVLDQAFKITLEARASETTYKTLRSSQARKIIEKKIR